MITGIIIGLLVLIVLGMVISSMNRSLRGAAGGINAAADKLGTMAARKEAELKATGKSRFAMSRTTRIILIVLITLIVILGAIDLLVGAP